MQRQDVPGQLPPELIDMILRQRDSLVKRDKRRLLREVMDQLRHIWQQSDVYTWYLTSMEMEHYSRYGHSWRHVHKESAIKVYKRVIECSDCGRVPRALIPYNPGRISPQGLHAKTCKWSPTWYSYPTFPATWN